jgi:hypothetical protein
MLDVAPVLQEYAKTMCWAQLFESALQAVAATELDPPEHALSSDELQERTELFFSRGIGWIQRRLELEPELAREIDALRRVRNELAHGYLLRLTWLGGDDADSRGGTAAEDLMPEHLRGDFDRLLSVIEDEHAAEARVAVEELRSLRGRFETCVSTLSSRLVLRLGAA